MKNFLLEKNPFLLLVGLLLAGLWIPNAQAQVKGISYTLSPTGDYMLWDKNTGISNGLLLGGQLGFGFGEFVELRATYLQSINKMERDFGALSMNELKNARLDTSNVGVQRWGGDLKINLSRGAIIPYLTVGTGVQTLSPDSIGSYKNIYVSAGGGLQFSVGDRYTLGVQAVNTSFNDSPVRSLTTAAERTANGLSTADYPNELLKNWSVRASMTFYLGGRRPGELSELDKAYLSNFSSGVSLPIEVTAGQLNFDKSLPFATTKFIGVSSGFNFGPYVGIRGFYWRGMEQDFLSTVDRLAVYGGEGKFKLSNGQGLTPSLSVGGGVIDALEGYEVRGRVVDVENMPFVSGGVGLDFPFSRSLKLTAYGKALLTSNGLLENTVNPDELSTSYAYGLSLNLILGNGAKPVEQAETTKYDQVVMENMKAERKRSDQLVETYEDRVNELNKKINDAQANDNSEKANALTAEKKLVLNAQNQLSDLRAREKKANREAFDEDNGMLLTMTPTEYRSLMDQVDMGYKNSLTQLELTNTNQRENFDALETRLKNITSKLDSMQLENREFREIQKQQMEELKAERERTQKLVKDYEEKIMRLEEDIRKAKEAGNAQEVKEKTDQKKKVEQKVEKTQEAQAQEKKANQEAMLRYDSTRLAINAAEFRAMINEIQRTNTSNQKEVQRSLEDFQKNSLKEFKDIQRENRNEMQAYRNQLEKEMRALRNEMEQIRTATTTSTATADRTSGRAQIQENSNNALASTTTVVLPNSVAEIQFRSPEQMEYQSTSLANDGFFSRLNYDGMSVFGGFSVGGSATINVGFRSHYRYKTSNFVLMPETFLGMGSNSTYGLLLNGVYEFKIDKAEGFNPYAGVGVGVLRIGPSGEESIRLGSNIILGANLFKVAGGRFYVDFSARNLFKYNQVAAGYRLPF